MKYLILVISILTASLSLAQEEDKALQKSNDYVYEANALVKEDFVAAEQEYRKAISKKPSHVPGAYNLGNAYYTSKLYSEALLRHLETVKLATTKFDKHQAYHNIGNALMQQKQCKEAVEAFKNALRNDPTDEETRYNFVLAKECAEQQGDGGGGGGDDDKENEDKKDQDKENEDKKDGDDKEDENKDEGDDKEDKKEGDDKEDKDGKPKDEKGDKEEQKPQPQQGKLSPQQVKNLLEAMNNQEKKVQEKINAKKVKGKKVKTEKDW